MVDGDLFDKRCGGAGLFMVESSLYFDFGDGFNFICILVFLQRNT
jgi:hypothetical protein